MNVLLGIVVCLVVVFGFAVLGETFGHDDAAPAAASPAPTYPVGVFLGDLEIRALDRAELAALGKDRQHFEVLQPFLFQSPTHGLITVPAHFISDFGSVPRPALWLVDDDDPDLLFASLPHDLLYATRGQIDGGRCFTRREADLILRQGMEALGAPAWKVTLVHLAVRIGGRRFWS